MLDSCIYATILQKQALFVQDFEHPESALFRHAEVPTIWGPFEDDLCRGGHSFQPHLRSGIEREPSTSHNLVAYGLLFIRKDRNMLSLTRFLGAVVIFSGGQPTGWIGHIAPGLTRAEWVFLSIFVCFFWLIFRSRNPRVVVFAALALVGFSFGFAPNLSHCAIQLALVSLLAHSLRWDDQAHRGATTLRVVIGALWILISCSWLFDPVQPARLLVDSAAALLSVIYLLHVVIFRNHKSLFVPVCAGVVLLSEPSMISARWLENESAGMVAIVASFLLFALGSVAAFSKPKWWRSG
jgi:hypothetical protein